MGNCPLLMRLSSYRVVLYHLDKAVILPYNTRKFIGQFVTILSVNKTRELMGALRLFFIGMGAYCAHFLFLVIL